jgi:hypothetical protein
VNDWPSYTFAVNSVSSCSNFVICTISGGADFSIDSGIISSNPGYILLLEVQPVHTTKMEKQDHGCKLDHGCGCGFGGRQGEQ